MDDEHNLDSATEADRYIDEAADDARARERASEEQAERWLEREREDGSQLRWRW
jgi:hypothetical protein